MSGMHVSATTLKWDRRLLLPDRQCQRIALCIEAPPIPVGPHLDRYSFRTEEACGQICPVSDGEEIDHRHNEYEIQHA